MARMLLCLRCNARHYWMRRETMAYNAGEKVEIICHRCGKKLIVYKSENGSLIIKGE